MKKFIETVVKNKEVFYLEVDESFAMCSSVSFYIEETNEAIPVAIGFKADLSGGEEYIPTEIVKALIDEIERTKTSTTFSDSFESLAQVKEALQMIGEQ